jgi:stage II sporulation protein P
MFSKQTRFDGRKRITPFYKKSGIYLISMIILFVFIGLLTTIKPAYRFSSQIISEWTSDIDSSIFLYLLSMENRAFKQAYPEEKSIPNLSTTFFQIATNIKVNDPKSLLGQELPGFSTFGNQIVIAGEGTNYMNLSIESSPPLEDVLEERQAILDDSTEKNEQEENAESIHDEHKEQLTTGDREVVLIYNTHNYESFLPHLPDVTDPDLAHHSEVNITKVSDRLAESLEAKGIGTKVDQTDFMRILKEKDWGYGRSYEASRSTVSEVIGSNKDLHYVFDLHRDSMAREITTKTINGKDYAKILMVVGAEYASYEKNLTLATELNALIEEKYPGLSRGVIKKEGPGNNGVYNQDLSENALLIEFGGYDNTLEELYRTADAVAEIFSEFYWDAEKVNVNQ